MADEKIDSIDRPRNASLGVRGISTSKTEKKTAAALKLPVSENAVPSLEGRATYNPFLALINLIRSIIAFFTGNAKEEAKSAPAVPEQQPPAIPNPTRTATNKLPPNEKVIVAPQPEDPKAIIAKQSSDHLFSQLALRYKEEGKARRVFDAVHPAFKAGVQKELNNTVDFQKLKEPLIALMKNLVLEHETSLQFQEIEANLKAGKLVLNRQEIFKQYPSLEADLKNIPDLAKKFEIMLSKAWISNNLTHLSKHKGSAFEKTVLKNLGFDVKKPFEVSSLGNELPSIENLQKKEISKVAFELRAIIAGVPTRALNNLRAVLKFSLSEQKRLMAEATTVRDNLNIENLDPAALAHIKKMLHSHNEKMINNHLASYIVSIREELSSSNIEDKLKPLTLLSADFAVGNASLQKAHDWFTKYQSRFIRFFSQTNDKNGLAEGTCMGLSYRMANIALKSPEKPAAQIAVTSIEDKDKAMQEHHDNRSDETLNLKLLPPTVLEENNQEEKFVFIATNVEGVRQGLITHLQNLKESNGAIILGWGSHATFMRFDPINKQFFFFDPNLGTLVFSRAANENDKSLATRMTNAYIELYQWAYPEHGDNMTAHQIITLKKGAKNPDKIPIYN